MLMALLPNLELAARRAPSDLAPLLHDAQRSAARAAEVVGQLMTYAGSRRASARRAEPLGDLVARTLSLARTTFDARITVEVQAGAGVVAMVDATQIEQALLNLLINARDALTDTATITPTIAVEVGGVAEGAPELEGRAGRWARLRISDNGVGMSPETLQRLYEPFFTTKETGKGTGLGLATTHGIVRDHGGFIACRSEPGRGTTFSLYLPAASSGAAAAEHDTGARAPAGRASRKAVVLVVDDDVLVRKAITMLLQDAGFAVESAASGEEALRIISAAETERPISLVLLDVSMPGIPGPLLRGRLRELVPEVPVIYLTGYAYQAADGALVLEKPVSAQQLVSAVEAALALRRSA
jgi:CheY-like chemotaxis protein